MYSLPRPKGYTLWEHLWYANHPHPVCPWYGVALDINQARVAIRQVQDNPGNGSGAVWTIGSNISVDMIIQSQRCRD